MTRILYDLIGGPPDRREFAEPPGPERVARFRARLAEMLDRAATEISLARTHEAAISGQNAGFDATRRYPDPI